MKNTLIGLAIAILSAIFSLVSMNDGAKIPTGDSMSYLNCSRTIYEKQQHAFPYYGLASDGTRTLEMVEKNSVWPPLTSFIISLFLMMGLSLSTSAKVFIVLFSFLSALLTYQFSMRITKSEIVSAIITILFVGLWTFHYWVGVSVMSEGLFVFITLMSSLFLLKVTNDQKFKPGLFIVAGILVGLTYLIKTAAPAFILAAGLLFFFQFPKWKQRFVNSIFFGVGVLLVLVPWLIRNLSLGTIGSAGSGPREHAIIESTLSLIRLFVPWHGSYTESKITLLFAAVFIGAIGLVILVGLFSKETRQNIFKRLKDVISTSSGVRLSLIYLISFVAVMFFAMYVLPLASHIETRYWMEVYPFVVPSMFVLISQVFMSKKDVSRKIQIALGILLVVVVFTSNVKEIIRNSHRNWIVLSSDNEKDHFCKTLATELELEDLTMFSSNHNVQFEIRTGLTSWPLDTMDEDFIHPKYFAAFEPDENSMNLSPLSTAIPSGYKFYKQVSNIKFFEYTE